LQPFALIMVRAHNVVIANVHLEGIFIIEGNRLVDLPLRTTLLALTVLAHQLLRVKLHLSPNCLRIKLHSLHRARIGV
jgi:hypothetical protein